MNRAPQVKLKAIIAILDARRNGGQGAAPSSAWGDEEDKEGSGEDLARASASASGRAGSGVSSGARPSSSRQTVLLSATLHRELSDLAAAILRDPVPVGFAVQQVRARGSEGIHRGSGERDGGGSAYNRLQKVRFYLPSSNR